MTPDFYQTMAAWDGEGVVVRHDESTDAWIFIALHDSTLGRPTGGTRMKVYPTLTDGLIDAQRLAEGMTHKWAGVEFPCGGGKAVIAIPRPLNDEEKQGLFRRYGQFLESLQGAYATGADLGTGPQAMVIIAQQTKWVVGTARNEAISRDPGPFTAHGVYLGIERTVESLYGTTDLTGRSVLVEGLGGVGEPLTRSLAKAGATLLLADLDHAKAEAMATELGGQAVPLDQVVTTPCDIYAPCAIGATLNRDTIPKLAAKAVAGSANNQLAEPEDAERLHERGIVYAPDYIINAGGAMAIVLIQDENMDDEGIMGRVEIIGGTVKAILSEAKSDGISPLQVARRRVERLLEERKAS